MADDLLITPGSRKLEIKDTAGNVDAKIETDASGNLLITNAGGDISIGDTSSDVFIGDGTNNVDIVFEQNGEIRGTSGVTITLGASGSSVAMGTDLSLGGNDLTNVNDITISGNLTVNGTTTTLDSTNTVIEDSIIELNSGLTGTNTKDIGFIFERGSTGNNAGFVWDESADRFTVFTTTDTAASDTVDTSSVANFQAGSFFGNGANLTSLNASNISSGTINSDRIPTGGSGNWWAGNPVKVGTDGVMEVGKYIDFHNTDAGTSDFDTRLYSNATGQLTINGNGRILTTNDEGAGNGLDADTLDSQHGSYYTNASNLGSGTVPSARLSLSASDIPSLDASKITSGRIDDARMSTAYSETLIGQSVHSLVSFTSQSDYSKRAGYSTMMRGTSQNSSVVNTPVAANYWFYNVHAKRDTGGGTAATLINYDGTNDFYSGFASTSTGTFTWAKHWTDRNDGASSGLNADLLDDQHGSYYTNASNISSGTISDARLPGTISSDITGTAAGLSGTPNISVGTISSGAITTSGNLTFSPNGDYYAGLGSTNALHFENSSGQTLMSTASVDIRIDANNSDTTRFFSVSHNSSSNATSGGTDLFKITENGAATFAGTISSGQISATTSADATPAIIATNTGGVSGVIQRWIGDTDSMEMKCIAAGDYSLLNTQQSNGLNFYDGTGGVEIVYNGNAVVEVDSGGGMNIASGPLRIGNNITINSNRDFDGRLGTFSSHVSSGDNSGGVAMTINDGYGNANLTFNHLSGTPEQNGQAARIEVNTDGTSTEGIMSFEISSADVTSGVAVSLPVAMTLAHDYLEIPNIIRHAGDTNTYIAFDVDRIRLIAGGTTKLDTNNTYLTGITSSDVTTALGFTPISSSDTSITNKMPLAGGTFTGAVTSTQAGDAITISSAAPQIKFNDTTSGEDDFWIHVNSNNFYVLVDRDGNGTWDGAHPLQLEGDTDIGYLFGDRIYTTDYHPEADTLTTARTIGGVSFDGSANINLPGVNTAGNQNTSGTAAGLSGTPNITVGTITSGTIDSSGNIDANGKFIIQGTGTLLELNQSGWNAGNQTHDILYGGWTASTGDYIYLSAAGNSNTSCGTILVTDGAGFYYGTHSSQGAITDSATDPLSDVKFRVDGSGNITEVGTISSGDITIGTGSNSPNLIIDKATTGTGSLLFRNGGSNKGKIILDSDEHLNFYTNGTSLALKIIEAGAVECARQLKFTQTTSTFETPGITYHTNNHLYIRGGSAGLILSDDGGQNTIQISDTGDYVRFETGDGSERVKITNAGLYITGTGGLYVDQYEAVSAPSNRLFFGDHGDDVDVEIQGFSGGSTIYMTDGEIFFNGSSNSTAGFKMIGTTGAFHSNGDVIAYSSTLTASDRRLKENVKALENPLEKVMHLQGVKYDWKESDRGTNQIGLIAQEVEEIVPEVVNTIEDSLGELKDMKVVNYTALVPMLIEAIKEQQTIINRLEERLNNLENKGEE